MLKSTKSLSSADVGGLDELNMRVARAVTRQITGNTSILCPCCKTYGQEQLLCQDEDRLESLFCPHCMLEFHISVNGWPSHYRRRSIEEWKAYINIEGKVKNV